MRTRLVVTAAVLASAALLGACGDNGGSDPDPTAGTSPSQGSSGVSLPHDGAPKVADPVDWSAWTSKPCDVITNEQLKSAGFEFPGMNLQVKDTSDPTTGPSCKASWGPGDKGFGFGVNLQTPNPQGLSSFYKEQKKEHRYKVFKPLGDVSGHPVLQAEVDPTQLDPGDCGIAVGLSDQSTAVIAVTARKSKFSKDPCEAGKTVAGLVIDTMKKGS